MITATKKSVVPSIKLLPAGPDSLVSASYSDSCFGQSVWCSKGSVPGITRGVKVDFANVDPSMVLFFKVYAYVLLNYDLDKKYRKVKLSTCVPLLESLINLTDYLAAKEVSLVSLTPNDLITYFKGSQISSDQKKVTVRALNRFYLMGKYFESTLSFNPAILVSYKGRGSENKTRRIDEDISGPLLAWSLNYVRVFGDNVLQAYEEVKALKKKQVDSARLSKEELVKQFDLWYSHRLESVGVFPEKNFEWRPPADSQRGSLDVKTTALLAGVPYSKIKRHVMSLDSLGKFPTGPACLDAPVDVPGFGFWRPSWHPKGVQLEVRFLQMACFITIAFLTGMRRSEVWSLKPGCCSEVSEGKYVVSGTVLKKAGTLEGTPASWVAVPEVAEAVRLLELLGLSDKWLFANDATGYMLLSPENWDSVFLQFVDHVNSLSSEYGSGPLVPTDGRIRDVTSRSFRRTLAWYLAQQPYGIVAGMLQLKHVKVSTFEGYSGTSLSGFKEELEEARRISTYYELRVKYERFKDGYGVYGGQDLEDGFRQIRDELGDYPGVVVDDFRLASMLSALAKDLYRGPLSDCLFDPVKAQCRPEGVSVEDFSSPVVATCKVVDCECSVVDCSKQAQWVEVRSGLVELESAEGLSNFERSYVCSRRERADKVLLQISKREGV